MADISQHRELKEALESAVNNSGLGIKIDLVASSMYRVFTNTSGGIWIFQPPIEVRITNTNTAPVCDLVDVTDNEIKISWETSMVRENGDPISLDEISHHLVEASTPDGGFTTELPAHINTYSFVYRGAGEYRLRMKTVDKGGLESDWSNEVVKEIQ